jgi:glycosyltransferase involved in cell wall biosynthesis/GT2 family glycosyltransferase
MINQRTPDFSNTPASDRRPRYTYTAEHGREPLVSIITPYYNAGPAFQNTVCAVERMSIPYWEWLIIDDGSTDVESLRQLEELAAREPRVRVIQQENRGPGVARNRAAKEACAPYLLQLDADDLVEPTFVEKALWLLATQPQFAACNSYAVTFGSKNLLWPHGFQEYEYSLDDNRITTQSVVRRDAWEYVGGYDERISYEHADWDFWLNLADAGLWGYTLPEYLTWYRTQAHSLLTAIETDGARTRAFRARLREKHRGLRARFPHPMIGDPMAQQEPTLPTTLPYINRLPKPAGTKRLLLIVPWLAMGGADKFNLDLIAQLATRGYECTVVTTAWSDDGWVDRFAALTPDIFCLHRFLTWAEYPRFLDYLIASRGFDALLLSNSELGYALLPYLRAHHPNLPALDYNHMEEESWRNGGYPAISVAAGTLLDRRLTCSDHLRAWEIERGAPAETTHTIYCSIDTVAWNPAREDTTGVRARLGIPPETPLILFAGRMVEQKRPRLAGQILLALAQTGADFAAVVAGDGPELAPLKRMLARGRLGGRVQCVGAQPEETIRALTAAADIALLPSAREGIALVLYEAMAMGTVPVAAAVGGQGELITPECGYLIAPGPDEGQHYVAALTTLLSDPARRQAMGEACRAQVVGQFDLAAMSVAMDAEITGAIIQGARGERGAVERAEADRQALIALQAARRWESPQAEWARRSSFRWIALARRTRERLLPMGSQRYLQYRRLKQSLSQVALPMRASSR